MATQRRHKHHLWRAGGHGLDESASWRQLKSAHTLISCAPDDEILAEMLACQQELGVQMLCNQTALAPLLAAAVEDLPRQAAARQQRAKMAEDMRAIVLVCCIMDCFLAPRVCNGSACLSSQRAKELRREAKRRKREEAQQAAKKSLEASMADSPGRVGPRTRVKVHEHLDTDSDVCMHRCLKESTRIVVVASSCGASPPFVCHHHPHARRRTAAKTACSTAWPSARKKSRPSVACAATA